MQSMRVFQEGFVEEEYLTSVSTARNIWEEWPNFQNEAMALQEHKGVFKMLLGRHAGEVT